jgi:HSP20 family protein
MSLIRWDPFREFNALPARNPAVDIFENDNEIVLKAELPGMNVKDIEVRLENNILLLKGERHFEKEAKEENYHRMEREYGFFSRSFALPTTVNADKVTAEYKDGILKVVLPKNEAIKPKPITVAAA